MKDYKDNKKEFRCMNCGWVSSEDMAGEEPEHCPNCLAGIHREDEQGYGCGGILEPVGVWVKSDDEWVIIQRCSLCGEMHLAPVAEQDSIIKLLSIASKPLSAPPFPIDRLEELTKIMGGRGNIK